MTMNIGMLWFDNTQVTAAQKIIEAANYYEKKYGKRPNLAFVHPTQDVEDQPEGIKVRTARSVMPNHIWIGWEAQ